MDDDIYELEKNWPEQHSPVRKVNLFVVDKGLELGVKTIIVPPPLICKFQTLSRSWIREFELIDSIRGARNRLIQSGIRPDPYGSPNVSQEKTSHDARPRLRCLVQNPYPGSL